jgi:hypothetical protein
LQKLISLGCNFCNRAFSFRTCTISRWHGYGKGLSGILS